MPKTLYQQWKSGKIDIQKYQAELKKLNDSRSTDEADRINAEVNKEQSEDFKFFDSADEPPTKESSKSTLVSTYEKNKTAFEIEKLGDKPESDFESKLTGYRNKYGIENLEDQLADIEAQEEELAASLRNTNDKTEDMQISMGAITGKKSKDQKEYMEKADFLRRQKQTVVSQLTAKNNVVNSLMSAAQMDYNNAVKDYDTQYNQNIQTMNLIKGIEDSQKTIENREVDNARANAQIVVNALSSGGLSYENLSDTERLNFQKLETQAGLPVGTFENITSKNPESKVLSTTTRVSTDGNKYADFLIQDSKTGEIKIQSVALGTVTTAAELSKNTIKTGKDLEGNTILEKISSAPIGQKLDRGQCGEFVNDVLGLSSYFGDYLDNRDGQIGKRERINSQTPAVGSVFIEDVNTTNGHVGIIKSLNSDGTYTVVEANYKGDETLGTRVIDPSKDTILGYFDPTQAGISTGGAKTPTEMNNRVLELRQKVIDGKMSTDQVITQLELEAGIKMTPEQKAAFIEKYLADV